MGSEKEERQSTVASPIRNLISGPINPVHVTHVGYDANTGQFTVSPLLWLNAHHLVGSAQGMEQDAQRCRYYSPRTGTEQKNNR
jgi:hypothetical protein